MNNSMVLSNFMFGENIDIYSKVVYMGLKKYVNKATGACFPAKKKLAEECGISMSTLNKAIKRLSDSGVLKKDFRFRENKSQTSNLYTLSPFLISGECFFTVRKDIFELGLQPKEVIVYSYLCSASNQDMECYPSIKTIATACNLSETTVKGTLKELINKNLIEKMCQYRSDGGKKNNLYKIVQVEVQVDDLVDETIIDQDQLNNVYMENSVVHTAHEEGVQQDMNITLSKNNSYCANKNISNKKIRKEIKRMKIRDDIFDFKLSENSFMVYLYINSCCSANKPYFPSVNEMCLKLKTSNIDVKASMAELQIKGLILSSDSVYPIGILNTPPWAKKIHP